MALKQRSELQRRAESVIPGGVNSPVRAMRAVGLDEPVFMRSGSGSSIEDVDGRRYVDWVMSWGPLVFGHADPETLAAIEAAASRGTTFGAPTEAEVELAEEIVDAVPSVELVRLVSSGTEATMSAMRLARAATRRDRILKFAGGYHGHVDALLVNAGSGLATLGLSTEGIPSSPGVPPGVTADTIVTTYNDIDASAAAVARYGEGLAAIVVEPVAGNMGVVPPVPGFLEALRALCDASGALLVFDEVITGFRVARGGAQERFGVVPDLTILGKIVGGGLPAAAFGGRAELMTRLAPAGDVYQAGTLLGEPARDRRRHLRPPPPPRPAGLRGAGGEGCPARGRPQSVRRRAARRSDGDAVPRRRPSPDVHRRAALRHGALRRALPPPPRPRHLHRAVAVRVPLRLARALGRGHRSHHRGSR